MNDRIYRYVVRVDAGAAPNPFGGWCSLAICKPAIRRTACRGDWIIGLRSRQVDRVTYVMQVQEVLDFATYWHDPRFRDKQPDRCATADNIYRPGARGEFIQVPNRVHQAHDIVRDLSGQRVLVSRRYWYFGSNSPQLPTELAHLIHESQGHSLQKNRKQSDVEALLVWLGQWAPGINGKPLDGSALNPANASATAPRVATSQKLASAAPAVPQIDSSNGSGCSARVQP